MDTMPQSSSADEQQRILGMIRELRASKNFCKACQVGQNALNTKSPADLVVETLNSCLECYKQNPEKQDAGFMILDLMNKFGLHKESCRFAQLLLNQKEQPIPLFAVISKVQHPITVVTNLVPFKKPERLAAQEKCCTQLEQLKNQGWKLNLVNVCFPDERIDRKNWQTEATLQRSAKTFLNVPDGRHLPMMKDLFSEAARIAKQNGTEYLVFTNSDIYWTSDFLNMVQSLFVSGFDTVCCSRTDIESWDEMGDSTKGKISHSGFDVFFCKVSFWEEHHAKFQEYILGEASWDWMYATIMSCYSSSYLLNNLKGLCYHVKHEQAWSKTPEYTKHIKSLNNGVDLPYRNRWHTYYMYYLMAIKDDGGINFEQNLALIDSSMIPMYEFEHEYAKQMIEVIDKGKLYYKWSANLLEYHKNIR